MCDAERIVAQRLDEVKERISLLNDSIERMEDLPAINRSLARVFAEWQLRGEQKVESELSLLNDLLKLTHEEISSGENIITALAG